MSSKKYMIVDAEALSAMVDELGNLCSLLSMGFVIPAGDIKNISLLKDAVMSSVSIRESVARYAQAMETKLANNDYKAGWREMPVGDLENQVINEVAWLIEPGADKCDEAVDVGAYCMMIYENVYLERIKTTVECMLDLQRQKVCDD